MQVILTQDVTGLGRKGEAKNVKNGYFRNYLLPQRLAQVATENRLKAAEKIRAKALIKLEELGKMGDEVKAKLKGLTLEFTRKITSKEKLYAALKPKDVIAAIKEKAKVELKEENVELKEAIKTLGEHQIRIKLTDKVSFPLKINILAEK